MMTRFVAVSVLSDKSGNVRKITFKFQGEELVELLKERFRSAKQLDESRNVVLHLPGVLPCVAFGIIAAYAFGMCEVARVEWCLPCPRK